MREREPITQTMKSSETRQQWSQVLNRVFRTESRVIVEKSGIPVAAIISTHDLERLTRLDEERKRDVAILDESQAAFKDVQAGEIERQVAKAVAAVRTENRRQRKPTARSA